MKVKKAKSGLYYRKDNDLGILVYSPFTGLIYSCKEGRKGETILFDWINLKSEKIPGIQYLNSLGVGWHHKEILNDEHSQSCLLSSSGADLENYFTPMPLVINWLLTTKCPLNCIYCYAQDVMKESKEPDAKTVSQTAKTILSYSPMVVTLTGGEPLSSPHLEFALKSLYGKTGVIVDTNGYSLQERHIKLFKKYDIFVRISLDTELINKNKILRPHRTGKASINQAIDSINLCLESGVPLGVQTTITKENMSDCESLGHKLYAIGVKSWRLMMVANHKGFDSYTTVITDVQRKRFYNTINRLLNVHSRNSWKNSIAVHVLTNKVPNAVILVTPEGHFKTEQHHVGKIFIDPENPSKPDSSCFVSKISMQDHVFRYLNLEHY